MLEVEQNMDSKPRSYYEFGSIAPTSIADKAGTPAFVLSRSLLRGRLESLANAVTGPWSGARMFYSMKANANAWVLRDVLASGWGLDACSTGDLWLAEQAGATAELISFTGVGCSKQGLLEACRSSRFVNLCTPAQVVHVDPWGAAVGIRVSARASKTGLDYSSSKFGLTAAETADAVEVLRGRGIRVAGIHCHSGSGVTDAEDLVDTLAGSILGVIESLSAHGRTELQYLNIGGGLGLEYDNCGGGLDPKTFGEAVAELMGRASERAGHRLQLHCEPGEWIAGPTGAILARVTNAFWRGETRIAIVDASLNQFMGTSYSRPNNALSVVLDGSRPSVLHDVFGATNSPVDAFCRARMLPLLQEGDLIIVHCAGAYGYSRGGRFNEHPQAPEVWIDGDRCAFVRQREHVSVLRECVPESLEWITCQVASGPSEH